MDSAAAIGLIERSPDNSRLIVIGSSEFLNDNVYQISASFGGDRFVSNLQLVSNAIDWFTEDVSLASIRSRGSTARILPPIRRSGAESVGDDQLRGRHYRLDIDRRCLAVAATGRAAA